MFIEYTWISAWIVTETDRYTYHSINTYMKKKLILDDRNSNFFERVRIDPISSVQSTTRRFATRGLIDISKSTIDFFPFTLEQCTVCLVYCVHSNILVVSNNAWKCHFIKIARFKEIHNTYSSLLQTETQNRSINQIYFFNWTTNFLCLIFMEFQV